ncbi:MAG: hypothetical protein IJV31_03715 [Clostridia bacterium]|nr:hypothetical protein [Clostridia bacterium]
MIIFYIIYILLLLIVALLAYAVFQLKLFGINIKDFWSFIEANQVLDSIYSYSKKYDRMSPQEQIVFLKEAEQIFEAFDKIPEALWEEEYGKYSVVLENYKNLKIARWAELNS